MRSSNRFRPATTSVTCLLLLLLQCSDRFSTSREQMVRVIEARGIHNAEVIAALRATPRHLFVPLALQPFAYEDRPLPIGNGATISQPFIVAWMTSLLDPAKTNRVLEIGTGSGYQAAVLSRLVREVYTIEIVPELAQSAKKRLTDLGISNVCERQGDGYQGWPEQAPFDRIILTAAPKEIPKLVRDELIPGGRLVAPVGAGFDQSLTVVDKDRAGALHFRSVGDVTFVPMVPR